MWVHNQSLNKQKKHTSVILENRMIKFAQNYKLYTDIDVGKLVRFFWSIDPAVSSI
jgi:hypothetical protein